MVKLYDNLFKNYEKRCRKEERATLSCEDEQQCIYNDEGGLFEECSEQESEGIGIISKNINNVLPNKVTKLVVTALIDTLARAMSILEVKDESSAVSHISAERMLDSYLDVYRKDREADE